MSPEGDMRDRPAQPKEVLMTMSSPVDGAMTTAIVGTGGIGSVIAGRLAAGGERLRLASADQKSARILASRIGPTAEVAVDNRQAVIGAQAVVLALRFPVLKGVIAEIADSLDDRVVVVPSNPFGVDPQGAIYRLLPKEQASGDVIAGWLPSGVHLAMAFGSLSAELFEASANRSPTRAVLFYATDDERATEGVERLIRTAGFEAARIGGLGQSSRLEVGGDLHDLVLDAPGALSLLRGSIDADRPATRNVR